MPRLVVLERDIAGMRHRLLDVDAVPVRADQDIVPLMVLNVLGHMRVGGELARVERPGCGHPGAVGLSCDQIDRGLKRLLRRVGNLVLGQLAHFGVGGREIGRQLGEVLLVSVIPIVEPTAARKQHDKQDRRNALQLLYQLEFGGRHVVRLGDEALLGRLIDH